MSATIDVSAAVHARAGLGRYAATLAMALDRERPGELRLFFANASPSSSLAVPLPDVPQRSIRLGYKPWRMAVWAGQLLTIGFDSLLGDTSLFHATEHLLMPVQHIPTVFTVHDLIYRLFPEHHKKLNYWFLNAAMPLFVRRADAIITVSETTRRDLVRLYGTPENKINVIAEAAAPAFKPQPPAYVEAVRSHFCLPDRYLLAVGTIEPRKNLARLVQVLATLRRDYPDLKLVVVGSRGWLVQSFFQAIERWGQADAIVMPGFVPDEDLPAIYCGAVAAVSASLYEGFGLPVLEAMACGVPVACSATSGLGEMAGQAALHFDPTQVEDMIGALRRLLVDEALRAALAEQGLKRAALFSWSRAAAETWRLYDRLRSQPQEPIGHA